MKRALLAPLLFFILLPVAAGATMLRSDLDRAIQLIPGSILLRMSSKTISSYNITSWVYTFPSSTETNIVYDMVRAWNTSTIYLVFKTQNIDKWCSQSGCHNPRIVITLQENGTVLWRSPIVYLDAYSLYEVAIPSYLVRPGIEVNFTLLPPSSDFNLSIDGKYEASIGQLAIAPPKMTPIITTTVTTVTNVKQDAPVSDARARTALAAGAAFALGMLAMMVLGRAGRRW